MKSKINSISRPHSALFITFLSMFLVLSSFIEADAVTNKPVLVGVSFSLSGRFSREGQDHLRGFRMWGDEINKRGGMLGRKVEVKYYDDQSEASVGVKLYEKLITDDKVDLLIGSYGSGIAMATTTVAEKHKMAMIVPGASSMEIWGRGYRYCFQMFTPGRFHFRPVLKIAKEEGFKTIAVAAVDSAYTVDSLTGILRDAKDFGLDVLFTEKYPLKVMDLSSLLYKIKAINPDIFLVPSYIPDGILLVRQAKEAQFVPKIISFSASGPSDPDFQKALGKDGEFLMGISQWQPTAKYPGAPEFVKAFKERYQIEPSYNGASSYSACRILEEAVKRVGSLDQDKLRDTIAKMDIMTVFGKFKVDPTGAQVGHEVVVVQIIEGKTRVVGPKEAKEVDAILPFPGWR